MTSSVLSTSSLSSSFSTDFLILNRDLRDLDPNSSNHNIHQFVPSALKSVNSSTLTSTGSHHLPLSLSKLSLASSINGHDDSQQQQQQQGSERTSKQTQSYFAKLALGEFENSNAQIHPVPITHGSNVVNVKCCQNLFVIQYSDHSIDLYGSYHMMDYVEPLILNLSDVQPEPLLITYFQRLNQPIVDLACTDSCIIVLLQNSIYKLRFEYQQQNQLTSMGNVTNQMHNSIPSCIWKWKQWSLHVQSIPYAQCYSNIGSIRENEVRFLRVTSSQNSFCIYTESHGILFSGPIDIEKRSFCSMRDQGSLQVIQNIGGLTVRQLECQNSYLAFITDDGKLYSMGIGMSGQLGQKSTASVSFEPQPVHGVSNVVDFVCASRFMVCLLKTGSIYYWGELPIGHFFHYPTLLHVSSGFTQLFRSHNGKYVLGLTEMDKIFCIGTLPPISQHIMSTQQVNEFVTEVIVKWDNLKPSFVCCGRRSIMFASNSFTGSTSRIDNLAMLQKENDKLNRDHEMLRYENSRLNVELQELRQAFKTHINQQRKNDEMTLSEDNSHEKIPDKSQKELSTSFFDAMDYSNYQNQSLEVEEEDLSMSIKYDTLNLGKSKQPTMDSRRQKTDESIVSEDSFISDAYSDFDSTETLQKYRRMLMEQERVKNSDRFFD